MAEALFRPHPPPPIGGLEGVDGRVCGRKLAVSWEPAPLLLVCGCACGGFLCPHLPVARSSFCPLDSESPLSGSFVNASELRFAPHLLRLIPFGISNKKPLCANVLPLFLYLSTVSLSTLLDRWPDPARFPLTLCPSPPRSKLASSFVLAEMASE